MTAQNAYPNCLKYQDGDLWPVLRELHDFESYAASGHSVRRRAARSWKRHPHADENYPVSTHSHASAAKVFLNLRRGMVRVADVLDVLRDTVPIERAIVMAPRDGESVAIHEELFGLLSSETEKKTLPKAEFYAEASRPETVLVIATGEEQRFANILLTIGIVKPGVL